MATPGLFDLPRQAVSERCEILRHGGGGAATLLVCGAVRFEQPGAQRLVEHLPRLLVVDASASPHAGWLHAALRFMADEARELRPGGEAVMTRLADILVIQAIRGWIGRDPAAQRGWLGALQDRQLGRARAAIHRDPARPWTLADLAAQAAMSRSAFSARFTRQVGVGAMQYVTQWRMSVAQAVLRDGHERQATLAGRVG